MNKSTFFTGQPVFSQLTNFISKADLAAISKEYRSDHYVKKFDTWHHLVTMLYSTYQQCTSLREIVGGLRACEGRLQPLGIKHFPTKSTFSDANARRSSEVFEKLYYRLYHRYAPVLPDSRLKGDVFRMRGKKLIIIDSTSIALFQEILKNAGRQPINGKRKGGIKVHMAVDTSVQVPYLVRITSAATSDKTFLKYVEAPEGSYLVFDKGYNVFEQYNRLSAGKINWVTRLLSNAVYEKERERPVNKQEATLGVSGDCDITLGHTLKKTKVRCRLITFWDAEKKRFFEFITNNKVIKASTVAALYKQRWQIEILFKRLKQNMPLKYFLGDNENAIRIQIWCALIADLLLKIVTCKIKRPWAFTNLASMVRLHLMNYTNLINYLNNPDKTRISMPIQGKENQLALFAPS